MKILGPTELEKLIIFVFSGAAKNLKKGGHVGLQQKPLKEPGIFQLLKNICSFFTNNKVRRGGGHGTITLPKYSLIHSLEKT